MTQYQFSLDSETLQHLFQGNSQLATFVQQVLNQVLDAQVSEWLGFQPYERSDQRQGYRNGRRNDTCNRQSAHCSASIMNNGPRGARTSL
jgi:transposase-like protein